MFCAIYAFPGSSDSFEKELLPIYIQTFLTFLNAAWICGNSKALVQFWLISIIAPNITVMTHFSLSRWDLAQLVEIFMHWQDSLISHVLRGIVSWAGELFWGKPPSVGCCGDRPCHAQRDPKHHFCYGYHIPHQRWDDKLQSGVQVVSVLASIHRAEEWWNSLQSKSEEHVNTLLDGTITSTKVLLFCCSTDILLSWIENVISQGSKNTEFFWKPA